MSSPEQVTKEDVWQARKEYWTANTKFGLSIVAGVPLLLPPLMHADEKWNRGNAAKWVEDTTGVEVDSLNGLAEFVGDYAPIIEYVLPIVLTILWTSLVGKQNRNRKKEGAEFREARQQYKDSKKSK